MNLVELVKILDQAGLALDPAAIMDALWLAQYQPDLQVVVQRAAVDGLGLGQSVPGPAPPTASIGDPVAPPPGHEPDPEQVPDPRPSARAMIDVFADAEHGRGSRRASAISIGAAPPLAERLAFMRAVRPFQQRWLSVREQELDEEATAEQTAEARRIRPGRLAPVLRPRRERWFDLDLVLEDDEAALLWSDTLDTFAHALRDTGAFRGVRRWRLRLDRDSAGRERALLQSPTGAHLPASSLIGSERRVVLFATHGSSDHWRTGRYAAQLAYWSHSSAVALLPLLPKRSWARTPLGDPGGTCSTDRAGVASARLDGQAFWWSDIDKEDPCLALPLVEFAPDAVARWAEMLMSRGKPAPALLLPMPMAASTKLGAEEEDQPPPDPEDLGRRVLALREVSPAAFELATLLCPTTFTVSVARLIQEAHFGKVNQAALSELFVSGLLVATSSGAAAGAAAYCIHPQATELLQRSLRGRDAEAVAAALIRRVSD